ncbi:MAG TPA: hypothetical protein VL598_09160, partial [Trinickia sp.]|uniref:hypothetical protein n=1 Tax=Trinickia sp. TaxID=2571163 RepID=UPI002C151D0D
LPDVGAPFFSDENAALLLVSNPGDMHDLASGVPLAQARSRTLRLRFAEAGEAAVLGGHISQRCGNALAYRVSHEGTEPNGSNTDPSQSIEFHYSSHKNYQSLA